MDCYNSNMIKLVLVILFAAIDKSSQTECYNCISDSTEQCIRNQERIKCSKDEICVTLETSKRKYIKDEYIDETRVQKFCQPKHLQCMEDCVRLSFSGHTKCEASCCDEDLCNKGPIEKKVWRGSKRSTSDGTNNSSPSLIISNTFQLVLSVAIAVLLVMK